MPFAGERFTSEVTLSPSSVAAYALLAGDTNHVHRDPEFARSTRFGRPIASGTHTTALLLGLTASHFSKEAAMVGLEFWVRFRRVMYADEKNPPRARRTREAPRPTATNRWSMCRCRRLWERTSAG
jgi:acyl dehydratase